MERGGRRRRETRGRDAFVVREREREGGGLMSRFFFDLDLSRYFWGRLRGYQFG